MRTLVALAFTTALSIPHAATADGETSPMLGGAVVGGAIVEDARVDGAPSPQMGAPSSSTGVAGVELEAAVWWRWIGLAAEVTARTPVDEEANRTVSLGGSLRVRLLQRLVPSLFEASDVELAIELQGIIERTVWDGTLATDEPYRRGLGLALRLRGSTDDDVPRLITESRFFVRILATAPGPTVEAAIVARATEPQAFRTREIVVLFGIGASFGGGEPDYLAQFRRRTFESTLLRP